MSTQATGTGASGNTAGHDTMSFWAAHARAGRDAARVLDEWEREAERGPRHYNRQRPTRRRRTPDWVNDSRRAAEERIRTNTARWDHPLPDGADVVVTAQYYGPARDLTVFRWRVYGSGGYPIQLWTPRSHRGAPTPIPGPPFWHAYAVRGRALDSDPDWSEIDADFPASTVATA